MNTTATPAWARQLAALACFIYTAGFVLGTALHQASAALGRWHCQALGLNQPQAEPQLLAAAPAPAPEPLTPTITLAQPLEQLSVVALRRQARERLGSGARLGGRRLAQARKADLVLALAAA